MRILRHTAACLLTLGVLQGTAQDTHFSQFMNTRTFYNPASAGAFNGEHRASMHYKNQWATVSSPFVTYAVSYDATLFKEQLDNGFVGAGFTAWSDKAGTNQIGTTRIGMQLAYHLELNDNNYLSVGLAGGFSQISLDPTNAQWDSQYDGTGFNGSLPSGEFWNFESISAGEIGGGVLWSTSSGDATMSSNDGSAFEAGASVYHVNQPNLSFYENNDPDKRHMKINVHANGIIGIKDAPLQFVPGVLYSQQGPNREIIAGTGFRFILVESSRYTGNIKETAITLGTHLRLRDAFIPSLTIEYASWAIAFSYDYNTSDLKPASMGKGGLELTLRYMNPNPFKGGAVHNKFF